MFILDKEYIYIYIYYVKFCSVMIGLLTNLIFKSHMTHTKSIVTKVDMNTKTSISFWCRWGLNPKSLIQLSKILPVELTETYN